MHLPASIEILLRLLLLIAGLLLPGSIILRAIRLPWSLAAAFITSSATLYVAVLIFACTGAKISLIALASALGAVTIAGYFIPSRPSVTTQPSSFGCFSKMGWWLWLYAAFWAVVAYRLVAQPLTGPDVYFRWSYLAEQMLRFGTLDFYPPRSGPDFVRYFWAESIPPGIASLYSWAYGCGGTKHALWTLPVVALQLFSLHEIIWRIANRWGGEVVANRAVLLAAACPLLTWSVLIGQETGLTALSVAGLVWCLQNARERNGRSWMALAGVCGIAAASTREYGPIFSVVAVVVALFMRLSRKHLFVLAAVSLPLSLAWPTRVWFLTGNPFYSLEVNGLFPVNRIFAEWSAIFHQPIANTFSVAANWQMLARYLALWALPGMIGLIALLFLLLRRLKEARILAVFVMLVIALWVLSVGHTAGGLFYSLRVLSPAFALLVIAGSYGLGFLNRYPSANNFISVMIALCFIEALPKSLVLPENPYRIEVSEWSDAGGKFGNEVRSSEQKAFELIRSLPPKKRGKILTDNAGLPRALAATSIQAIPPWSPEIAGLFDPKLTPADAAKLWHQSGIHYVFIGKGSPTAAFIPKQAKWDAPYFTVSTVIESNNLLILEVADSDSTAVK